MHPLYPAPDININGWTRDSYSEQQLLARVKTIYSLAIEGYQQLVNTWFPKFAPRLATAVTLPARLVGVVTPTRFNNTEVCVQWYFKALQQGQSSYVDLSFGEPGILIGNDHLYSQVNEKLLFLRKDAAAWIRTKMSSQLLSISKPNSATELAYEWLWNDLKQVNWVDGTLGNAPLSGF
ncbi:MAG: hypothetical protein QNJ63_08450 [Calothrix sp. MO_192.B10]|nr:hypothetical protein [Calothrix sp. MO_192.B10]